MVPTQGGVVDVDVGGCCAVACHKADVGGAANANASPATVELRG